MPTPAEFLRRMAPAQSHEDRRAFLTAADDLDSPTLAELHKLRDEAELVVTALMDLLPVVGSWGEGYRVSDSASSSVTATHAEWVTAAWHLCCLHAILAGLPEPETPTDVDCTHWPHQTQAFRTEATVEPVYTRVEVDWHGDSIDGPALPNTVPAAPSLRVLNPAERHVIAETWNGNESGRLWTAQWYVEPNEGGRGFNYFRSVSAPGVFTPPRIFANQQSFYQELLIESTRANINWIDQEERERVLREMKGQTL